MSRCSSYPEIVTLKQEFFSGSNLQKPHLRGLVRGVRLRGGIGLSGYVDTRMLCWLL
jgi:hypothetical protein